MRGCRCPENVLFYEFNMYLSSRHSQLTNVSVGLHEYEVSIKYIVFIRTFNYLKLYGTAIKLKNEQTMKFKSNKTKIMAFVLILYIISFVRRVSRPVYNTIMEIVMFLERSFYKKKKKFVCLLILLLHLINMTFKLKYLYTLNFALQKFEILHLLFQFFFQ